MDIQALSTTDFAFPGQTALYHGKVRDVYSLENDQLLSIATDRISAFDVILPCSIPFKGQVLNQTAEHFLQATADIVPNWLEATPDPNVSIGTKAEPFKIEMVVRGVLVGHAWREYETGQRQLCGEPLPENLKEYDRFPAALITPSTKADEGHDEDISAAQIIEQNLCTTDEWASLSDYAYKLFARGQDMADQRGLVLADTKYEFGKLPDGSIVLIDEVHTPDSSRYFYKDTFEAYVSGQSSTKPKHLSKEFVREWLMERGFDGHDQPVPELDDTFVQSVSERYIELFERVTGQAFIKADTSNISERIKTNVLHYLQKG